MSADALALSADALALSADALALSADALALSADALVLSADALALSADALALQSIAKFNSLRINEMLYLVKLVIRSCHKGDTQLPEASVTQIMVLCCWTRYLKSCRFIPIGI
ncbi:hypothetical protein [uncultured Nostoc sp.]|uniref:hypothetical protein n=1 Tax=uncultured Nostoc sp. TaxID=340711 RepID=UPI0035CB88EE